MDSFLGYFYNKTLNSLTCLHKISAFYLQPLSKAEFTLSLNNFSSNKPTRRLKTYKTNYSFFYCIANKGYKALTIDLRTITYVVCCINSLLKSKNNCKSSQETNNFIISLKEYKLASILCQESYFFWKSSVTVFITYIK